jgi:hypothetical protein
MGSDFQLKMTVMGGGLTSSGMVLIGSYAPSEGNLVRCRSERLRCAAETCGEQRNKQRRFRLR